MITIIIRTITNNYIIKNQQELTIDQIETQFQLFSMIPKNITCEKHTAYESFLV